MSSRNSAHKKVLEKIARHASEFCEGNVISTSIEESLIHRGKIIAQPDVTLRCSNKEIHIIEYKGNGNGEHLKRAQDQLNNASFWYGKYTDLEPDKINLRIISGDDPKHKELFK
jgi:hypothetical protein